MARRVDADDADISGELVEQVAARELSTMRKIYNSLELDEDTKQLYFDVILSTATEAIRTAMERSMNADQEREFSTYFRDTYQRGVTKGLDQGFEIGLEHGRVTALKASLRNILHARNLPAGGKQLERIEECQSGETLELWITQAVTAKTTDEAMR